VAAFAGEIGGLEGAAAVVGPEQVGPDTWRIDVLSTGSALSGESKDLVGDIRALDGPDVLVGGVTASFLDQQESLAAHLPWAILIVAAVTVVALFMMTGSVLLPVKAVIMNILTLGATLGMMVFVFQDGRLTGPLGYDPNGALDLTQPILLGALAFGLSTDYAVFLLSRIKEARDAGLPNDEAVAVGLQRTGRVVTAAALLFAVAIGAFATSEIKLIKELGVGTAFAVLVDATIIRAFLVPSLMKLLGEWNWWAPGPLRRFHDRFGWSEAEPSEPAPVAGGATAGHAG
jgi:RND superfamily putative drug exporter